MRDRLRDGALGRNSVPSVSRPAVQVFGRRDSRDTQKALRFFKERRVSVHFVDIAVHPPAPGELRRFAQRLGMHALLDVEGRRYRDLGLGYMRLGDDELFERLLSDPALLRLPLVRLGNAFTAGMAERVWGEWALKA
ncbi:MAG: arsenate reductase family protein [Candidatus Limnocylindrales bacterium]